MNIKTLDRFIGVGIRPRAHRYLLTAARLACSIAATKLIKTFYTAVVVLSLALAAVSCSPKSEASLVGKWASGNDLVFTFTKDGDMIRQEGAGSETMGYSVSGTTLYLKPKDLPTSLGYAISFPSEKELVLTPQPIRGVAISRQDTSPIRLSRVSD